MAIRKTREKVAFGFGLGALLVAGAFGAILGAEGCSNSNSSTPSEDAAMPETSVTADTGSMEGSASTGDGASSESGSAEGGPADAGALGPKVFLVHASPNAPPVRFCFGLGSPTVPASFTVASAPPLPDKTGPGAPFPALFPGTGGSFASSVAGVDIGKLTLSVYAVNAEAITTETADGGPDGGAEVTCDQLINPLATPDAGDGGDAGAGFLTLNQDYFYLGTINTGTLKDNASYLIAMTGCVPGSAAPAAYCGTGYTSTTSNLALTLFTLDSTTKEDAGTLGAQFAQASTPWDYVASMQTGMVTVAAFVSGDGGSVITPVASDAGFGSVTPSTLVPVSGLALDGSTQFYAAITSGFGGGADGGTDAEADGGTEGGAEAGMGGGTPMFFAGGSLPFIAQLTYGANAAQEPFVYGKGYVFVLVGDPTQSLLTNPIDGGPIYLEAGASPNLEAAHILAFPTSNP